MRPEISNGISSALKEIAVKLRTDAQELCPADTGALRRSIEVIEVSPSSIVIGTKIEYAPYVEFGTDPMISAHGKHDYKRPVTTWKAKRDRHSLDDTTMPFLSRALYSNLRWILETIRDHIRRQFK